MSGVSTWDCDHPQPLTSLRSRTHMRPVYQSSLCPWTRNLPMWDCLTECPASFLHHHVTPVPFLGWNVCIYYPLKKKKSFSWNSIYLVIVTIFSIKPLKYYSGSFTIHICDSDMYVSPGVCFYWLLFLSGVLQSTVQVLLLLSLLQCMPANTDGHCNYGLIYVPLKSRH